MTISAGSPTEAHHMWPAYTSSLQMALIPCQKFKKDNNDRSHTSDQDHLQSRCTADIRRLQKSRSLGAFKARLKQLRRSKEAAYRSGDQALYNQARNTLNKEIRAAKKAVHCELRSVEVP
ncbi:hypothetical protein MHYP_G00279600 [Metynnis hypsauchen]